MQSGHSSFSTPGYHAREHKSTLRNDRCSTVMLAHGQRITESVCCADDKMMTREDTKWRRCSKIFIYVLLVPDLSLTCFRMTFTSTMLLRRTREKRRSRTPILLTLSALSAAQPDSYSFLSRRVLTWPGRWWKQLEMSP